ncbi:MAG TPA: hypothetical protein DCQ29_02745 [Chitinophagaceae bacterium]|nr:hypothetical protein [Chitinophagaceae bacterium]
MKRLIFIVLLLPMLATNLQAQDPHFSQFFASPLALNPAYIGKIDGQFRVAGNHRNQWPTINRAFITSTVSLDMALGRNALPNKDTWGVGIMGYTDRSAGGAVMFNYGSLGTSYHLGLDEDGYKQIGIGFQATYANMSINTSQLKFEDQLTTSGFTGVTSEIFNNANLNTSYFDLNAGLMYSASTTDRNHFYAGVSMYHINQPKQQFTGALYILKPRTTFHAGGYFPLGQMTTLHFSGLYSSQAKATEAMLGGALQFFATDPEEEKPVSFYAGSWVRFNDAIIPYIGMEFSDFRLGVTYDVNNSTLRTASERRGGIELSLIYVHRPPESRGLPCPKF